MSVVSIEVVREAGPDKAGDAVIRLNGMWILPEAPTFRIEPIDDESGAPAPDGWPAGDLAPIETRIGDQGVELVLGPEVTQSPALLPGTPVVLTVPAAQASTELLWPSLPIARPRRRGGGVVTGERRAADLAARAAAQRAEIEQLVAAIAAADKAAVEMQTRDALSRLKSRPPSEPPPPALPDLVGAASAVETAAPRVSEARLPAGLSLGSPATAAPPVDVDAPVDARAVNDAIDTAPPSHALTPPPLPPQPAEPQMTVPIDPSEAPTEIVVPETATSPTSKQVEVARPPATPARIEIATAVRKPDREPRLMRAFAIAFVVTGALAGLLFLLAPGRLPAPAAVLATQEADRLTLLTKLLDVPDRSERGLDTANVNIDEALKRADRLISEADASRDADEAKFWLRRALVLGLGDRRMGWAMTQLGTLYASPRSGPPDYATARVLWELSAAQGDPVAFCFLATLYEQGLGVPAQPAEALANYRRARANGGCRDVDAAIARLSSQGR